LSIKKLSTIQTQKNNSGFFHKLFSISSSNNFSLFFSEIFLESQICFKNFLSGIFLGLKHKAQATTHPAQGHLPASSTQILYILIFYKKIFFIIIFKNKKNTKIFFSIFFKQIF
jgi:hypothetical protein